MKQEDLRNLSPRHAVRDMPIACAHLIHITPIVVVNPYYISGIAASESPCVRCRVDELVVVQSHRGHGIAVARQKDLERAAHLQIRTNMQKRMTEVSESLRCSLQESACHRFASEHVR